MLSAAPDELTMLMKNRVSAEKKRLNAASDAIRFNSPISRLERDKKELEKFRSQLPSLMDQAVLSKKTAIEKYRLKLPPLMNASLSGAAKRRDVYISSLEGLSPLLRLKSGFSYVSDKNGKNIRSVQGIKPGDALDIRVTDGRINATVNETEEL